MTEDTGDVSAPAGQVPGENENRAGVSPHPKISGSEEQRRPGSVHIQSDVDWSCAQPGKAQAQQTPSAKVSQPEPRPQLHIYPAFACTHREEQGKERLFC